MKLLLINTIICLVIIGITSQAFASEKTVPATQSAIPISPPSPAFEALGHTPSAIMRPTNVQTFAAGLQSAFDTNGNIKPGVGMEIAPLWLILGSNTTLKDWRENYGKRLASRISLSMATAPHIAEDHIEISEGLKITFWDNADPRFDIKLEKCIKTALGTSSKNNDPSQAPNIEQIDDIQDIVKADNPGVLACRKKNKQRFTNGSGFSIATAFTQVTLKNTNDAKFQKAIVWANLSLALGGTPQGKAKLPTVIKAWGQVVFGLKHEYDNLAESNKLHYGVRLRAANANFGVAADISLRDTWIGDTKEHSQIPSLIIEAHITDNFWLNLNAGGILNGIQDEQELFTTLSLNIGRTKK